MGLQAGCPPGLCEASKATTSEEAPLFVSWVPCSCQRTCIRREKASHGALWAFRRLLDGGCGFVSGGVVGVNVIPMCECSVQVETMYSFAFLAAEEPFAVELSLLKVSFVAGQ